MNNSPGYIESRAVNGSLLIRKSVFTRFYPHPPLDGARFISSLILGVYSKSS